MAVFTPVTLDDLTLWSAQFPLGRVLAIKGISSGIENSNFFITTETGEYVLTLFEKLTFQQLPFYLNLMRHLADRGVLVPAPIANHQGQLINRLKDKPASIVTKLEGACQMSPAPDHCAEVGAMLAKMHLAGRDFPIHQPNLRGVGWWKEATPKVLPFLQEDAQRLLGTEMAFQEEFAASDMHRSFPSGPIHADLFRNNVMFDGHKLTGFFDFYFAGYDTWLFDVAISVNDWCIDPDSGVLDPARVRALLDAYHAVRPFSAAERAGWQAMLRAGALRFWLSRLYDYHLPRDAEMLTAHDPAHFERILRLRVGRQVPELFNS